MATTKKKTAKAATKAKQPQPAPAKTSKTWEAVLAHQGYLIVNDPAFLQ